jgi:hypothetical protein
MPVRGLAQEGRFYFSRNAAHGNGTFRVFYVELGSRNLNRFKSFDHASGYAPTYQGWACLDFETKGSAWIHLADHAAGHEAIAATIAEHWNATKKSG